MYDETEYQDAELKRREERAERGRARRREALIEAARVLIPEHGVGMPLARIAVRAGLPRGAATALYNATSDLATELVRRAHLRLIERSAAVDGAGPSGIAAFLIEELGADPAMVRIEHALACGATGWQRTTLADSAFLLTAAVAHLLRVACPALAFAASERAAGHLLALARHAASAPGDSAAAAAEIATLLAAMLPDAHANAAAAAAAAAEMAEPPTAEAPPDPAPGATARTATILARAFGKSEAAPPPVNSLPANSLPAATVGTDDTGDDDTGDDDAPACDPATGATAPDGTATAAPTTDADADQDRPAAAASAPPTLWIYPFDMRAHRAARAAMAGR